MLWKSDQVKFHPANLGNTFPLSCVKSCFGCPSCHCQRGNTFIAWHELAQRWEIKCVSKGLCHGGALWMDPVSWSDFHSPCCAKLLIAVWMEATLKEGSLITPPQVHMLTMQWCLLICLTRDACLLSPYLNWALSLLPISSNSGLSCNRVHGCVCSEAYTKKNFIPFLRTAGERKVALYSTESYPLHHSIEYLFIYPLLPFWSVESLERKMH